jgi:hypothetical protein
MSDLICPKCGSDKIFADKTRSDSIRLTCLSCSYEFKPGQGYKSKSDFSAKQKIDKQGCIIGFVILFVIFLAIIFILKFSKDPSDQKNNQQLISGPFEKTFYIDTNKLLHNSFSYLDEKAKKISILFTIINEIYSNPISLQKFVKGLSSFDSMVVVRTNGRIQGSGYITCEINNKTVQPGTVIVEISSGYESNLSKVILNQSITLERLKVILVDPTTFDKIIGSKNLPVKFKARIFTDSDRDKKYLELLEGNLDTAKIQTDLANIRLYKAEFELIELMK